MSSLLTLDTQIFYFLNSLAGQSLVLDNILVFFASYFAYILILIFLYWLVFYVNREKLQIFFVITASALIAKFGITELIRFFYHRSRPFIDLPSVNQLIIHENSGSFPSGHAAFFFAISMAIYMYNKRLGALFFIFALFMTISRVIAGVHYPSDIIGGALVGIFVAQIVFRLIKKSNLFYTDKHAIL